jgi:hypothetical protein
MRNAIPCLAEIWLEQAANETIQRTMRGHLRLEDRATFGFVRDEDGVSWSRLLEVGIPLPDVLTGRQPHDRRSVSAFNAVCLSTMKRP